MKTGTSSITGTNNALNGNATKVKPNPEKPRTIAAKNEDCTQNWESWTKNEIHKLSNQ